MHWDLLYLSTSMVLSKEEKQEQHGQNVAENHHARTRLPLIHLSADIANQIKEIMIVFAFKPIS
jgi:hypothetical protein